MVEAWSACQPQEGSRDCTNCDPNRQIMMMFPFLYCTHSSDTIIVPSWPALPLILPTRNTFLLSILPVGWPTSITLSWCQPSGEVKGMALMIIVKKTLALPNNHASDCVMQEL